MQVIHKFSNNCAASQDVDSGCRFMHPHPICLYILLTLQYSTIRCGFLLALLCSMEKPDRLTTFIRDVEFTVSPQEMGQRASALYTSTLHVYTYTQVLRAHPQTLNNKENHRHLVHCNNIVTQPLSLWQPKTHI